MAIEEYTVQNIAPPGQINDAMDPGAVEKVKIEAMAAKTNVQVETARAEEGERSLLSSASSSPSPSGSSASSGSGKSNPEAKVYGDILTDALGLKTITTAMEFMGERIDAAKGGMNAGQRAGLISGNARTFDQFAMSHGVNPKRDIIGDVNLAGEGLNSHGKAAVSTWPMPDKQQKMASVQLAKTLGVTHGMAHEQTYNQALAYQKTHSAAMSMSMGLGSGPSYKTSPQEARRIAEESEKSSWTTS